MARTITTGTTGTTGTAGDRPPWHRRTFSIALLGGLLMWAVFAPLALWPLAWLAPLPWLWLVRMPKLPARRPYGAIYLAGYLHWLLLVQWVRLPHWSAHFGWLLLAFYLAFYVPVFIGLTRVAVHQLRVPLLLAAPIVWTGLELARGHLMTGFSLALLGHTQVDWIELIQIADLTGAYGVSFVVMFAAACLTRMLPVESNKLAWWPLAPLVVVLGLVLAYGHYRLNPSGQETEQADRSARIALVQGSIDTKFDGVDHSKETFDQYMDLTYEILSDDPDLDLIVWPESMFSCRWVKFNEDVRPPPESGLDPNDWKAHLGLWQENFHGLARMAVRSHDEARATPLLAGTTTFDYRGPSPRRFNSALLIDRTGKLVGRYDKMHPVMFGEYVPLGEVFPWLYKLTPMSGGLTPGEAPRVFRVAGLNVSPCICFENTVPHLVRRQIVQLRAEGQEPDVLVTITNDGWFWGSSLLDLHLTCGRFRAVEARKPMLIAANTGFSAWIDASGRLIKQGPRRDRGVIVAHVKADRRQSGYLRWGDLLAGTCLILCLLTAVWGVNSWLAGRRNMWRPRRQQHVSNQRAKDQTQR